MDTIEMTIAIRNILMNETARHNPLSHLVETQLDLDEGNGGEKPKVMLECREGQQFTLILVENK